MNGSSSSLDKGVQLAISDVTSDGNVNVNQRAISVQDIHTRKYLKSITLSDTLKIRPFWRRKIIWAWTDWTGIRAQMDWTGIKPVSCFIRNHFPASSFLMIRDSSILPKRALFDAPSLDPYPCSSPSPLSLSPPINYLSLSRWSPSVTTMQTLLSCIPLSSPSSMILMHHTLDAP